MSNGTGGCAQCITLPLASNVGDRVSHDCQSPPFSVPGCRHHGASNGVKGNGLDRRENRNSVEARTALTPCGSETTWKADPRRLRCGRTARSRGGLVTSSETRSPEGSRCRCSLGTLGECLQPTGNDLDSPSSAAIGGLPLAALEPTLNVYLTALLLVLASEGCQ